MSLLILLLPIPLNIRSYSGHKALEDHDKFTSIQLAELREKVEVEIEGNIAGLQTEMRQRFTQIEATQQEHTTLLTEILSRLPEKQ